MEKDNLDELLYNLLNEELQPSEKLILKTTEVIKRDRKADRLLGLSIAVNAVVFLCMMAYMLLVPHQILLKIIVYSVISSLANLSVLMVIAFKDKLAPYLNSQ